MSRIAVSFPPRPGPLAAGGGAFVQMTAVDGLEHEIGPDDHSSGLGRGCYRAMCGAVIAPASLTASPGAVCRVCAQVVLAARQRAKIPGGMFRLLSRVSAKRIGGLV